MKTLLLFFSLQISSLYAVPACIETVFDEIDTCTELKFGPQYVIVFSAMCKGFGNGGKIVMTCENKKLPACDCPFIDEGKPSRILEYHYRGDPSSVKRDCLSAECKYIPPQE